MHTAKTNILLPFLILMYLYFLLIHLSVLVEFLVCLFVCLARPHSAAQTTLKLTVVFLPRPPQY